MSLPPLAVFDLDGTLVDSLPDLADTGAEMLRSYDLPPVDTTTIRRMIGDGVAVLVERLLDNAATLSESDMARISAISRVDAVTRFMALYEPRVTRLSRPFPDTLTTLKTLKADGWALAVCTNKPVKAARSILHTFGLADMLSAVGGGDSFAVRKPDPGHLLGTIALAGGTPHKTVMIGDHANDIRAAMGAGAESVFAEWGYGIAAFGEDANACAPDMAHIPAILERLRAAWPVS